MADRSPPDPSPLPPPLDDEPATTERVRFEGTLPSLEPEVPVEIVPEPSRAARAIEPKRGQERSRKQKQKREREREREQGQKQAHQERPARKPPRRQRPDEERKLSSAGHGLVICALALAISLLLNAPGAHKKAYNLSEGWQRDVALAVTGPIDAVSGALLLDQPRAAVQAAVGRSGDDEIDVAIAIPDTTDITPSTPATGPGGSKPNVGKPKPSPAVPVKQKFTPDKKLRLWVAGDSLVINPGWSIVRASGASPVIESVGGVDGRVATGLTRPDVFNWFEQIRAKVKELKPGVVVMSFGGNDDKAYMTGVPEGVSIGGFGDASWRKEYGRRVGGVMDIVARKGGHVIWIGLPQTRDAEQTRRFDVVNSVVARQARKRPKTATFLDTYTMFASETGGFTEYLPDRSGNETKVRAGDGVHFERAGGDMIAREVLKVLNKTYDLTSWKRKRADGA
jgi:hypothetical protein